MMAWHIDYDVVSSLVAPFP